MSLGPEADGICCRYFCKLVAHRVCCTQVYQCCGGPMARHLVRFRSSAGRPPGDRVPDGSNRVKQVNTEKGENFESVQLEGRLRLDQSAMLQLLPLLILPVVIGAEQFVPETIFLPYSETEDVDFTIERPGRVGCYQW